MNKKQSWIKKYWWAILLSLLILGYFIFVSIINDCCLNRITSDLLNYINLIITPVGVILGLVLGYPLLKKKVVEGYVKKQFDIMDNSNREVTESYEDIIHSPNVDHANVVLLFANVSMYAERYNIDTSELRLKTIVAGFKDLF